MSGPKDDKNAQSQIDAVLDAALDELDDDDHESTPKVAPSVRTVPGPLPTTAQPQPTQPLSGNENDLDMGAFDDMMKQLLASSGGGADSDAALGALMQQLQSQLVNDARQADESRPTVTSTESPGVAASTSPNQSGSKPKASKSTSGAAPSPSSPNASVDRTISQLLQDMSSMPASEASSNNNNSEQEMLNEMMKEFENIEGDISSEDVIDGMMKQLLSKELMYEPMKQVTEKFPAWLETHKDTLSEEDFKQRTQQYERFKQLIKVYEREPDNTEKLMDLMQEVQEFGQPPPEIIQEIAPGLELDSEGLPRLDGTAENPFGNEECSIM